MWSDLDQLLAEASVLVVMGPGGVGKTTVAAAMGARAARELGRRVLVVTVDPARRLADALGVADLAEEPVLVSMGSGQGRLWALMVDMGQSWDRLVRRHSPDGETRDLLLANRLYRSLTQKFVQSHDYIALDRLADLVDDDTYDLVVIDTPPSVHALGVLDAPDHMVDFFGSRFLTWLTAPYRNRLVRAAAAPFLAVAERILGGSFLAEVTEFFWLFTRLQPGFVRRAQNVKATLAHPATRYVIVQTPEIRPSARARELGSAIRERGYEPSLVVVNRSFDPSLASLQSADLEHIDDPVLRAAVDALLPRTVAQDADQTAIQTAVQTAVQDVSSAQDSASNQEPVAAAAGPTVDWGSVPIATVPTMRRGINHIDDLVKLLD